MIIRVEEVLENAFSDFSIDGLDKLNFGYGDEKELDAVIIGKTMNNQIAYPLLWYVMPNELTTKEDYAEGNFRFILAHNTELDWFNDQRFRNVYNTMLFPYLEKVLDIFNRSHRITSNAVFKTTNYPNYSKTLKTSEKVDYWDAIELKIDLKIHKEHNC